MVGIAAFMSTPIALSRAGLLKTIQPMPSSLQASIFSVSSLTCFIAISSHDAALVEVGDGVVVVTKLGEHGVGMFAELRGGQAHAVGLRRAGQMNRLADDANLAAFGVRDRPVDRQVLHLLIGERAGDVVDRSAGHAGVGQEVDPVLAGLLASALGDRFVERDAVLGAADGVAVVGVLEQLGRLDRPAQAGEDFAAGCSDVDLAVAGFEDPGGHRGGVIVAGLPGDLVVDQIAGRLQIEHGDLGFEQRGVDPLSLAGAFAFVERDQDGLSEEAAGCEVGDRDADAHRSVAGQCR